MSSSLDWVSFLGRFGPLLRWSVLLTCFRLIATGLLGTKYSTYPRESTASYMAGRRLRGRRLLTVSRRVPDPAAGRALRFVPVLVHRPWHLYVPRSRSCLTWNRQLTNPPSPLCAHAVYIFVGCILLHDGVLRIIAGSIIGVIGVGYVALEFVPSIEPPANMREADAGWGAEQV